MESLKKSKEKAKPLSLYMNNLMGSLKAVVLSKKKQEDDLSVVKDEIVDTSNYYLEGAKNR